jgi:DNA polymerase I-like protein with 3'-5' exonuclease and polymerase domains
VVEVDGRQGDLIRYSQSWGLGDGMTAVVEAADHVRPRMTPGRRRRLITQYAPADMRHLQRLVGPDRNIWAWFTIDDLVWKHGSLYSDMAHDLDFLGSVFGSINRHKHLAGSNPLLYAGCDTLVTLEADLALEREFDRDPQSRRVYEEVDRPVIRHYVERQYKGLRVWPERVAAVAKMLEADKVDAQARATAHVGWPINLGSNDQVGHRLFIVEGLKKPRGVGKKRKKR